MTPPDSPDAPVPPLRNVPPTADTRPTRDAAPDPARTPGRSQPAPPLALGPLASLVDGALVVVERRIRLLGADLDAERAWLERRAWISALAGVAWLHALALVTVLGVAAAWDTWRLGPSRPPAPRGAWWDAGWGSGCGSRRAPSAPFWLQPATSSSGTARRCAGACHRSQNRRALYRDCHRLYPELCMSQYSYIRAFCTTTTSARPGLPKRLVAGLHRAVLGGPPKVVPPCSSL